jgi:hypothetical protein
MRPTEEGSHPEALAPPQPGIPSPTFPVCQPQTSHLATHSQIHHHGQKNRTESLSYTSTTGFRPSSTPHSHPQSEQNISNSISRDINQAPGRTGQASVSTYLHRSCSTKNRSDPHTSHRTAVPSMYILQTLRNDRKNASQSAYINKKTIHKPISIILRVLRSYQKKPSSHRHPRSTQSIPPRH